jgi:hypothetical protein
VIGPLGAGDNVGEVTGVVAEDVDVVDAGVVISTGHGSQHGHNIVATWGEGMNTPDVGCWTPCCS